jgi:hypothetical protein
MDRTLSAASQYRQAVHHLAQLPASQQILALKYELFHALQRGNDLQDRARDLEVRVAQLEGPPSDREAMLDAFAQTLHEALGERATELETARRDYERDTRQLRLALHAAETHCELLDELCHNLVATIERAADDEVSASPEPAERPEQVAS